MIAHRHHLTALPPVLVVMLCGLCGAPATAQSNSLLHRSPRNQPTAHQVPTTQPAGGVLAAPALGLVGSPRAAFRQEEPEPQPNVVLLNCSPFAVEMPQTEKIRVHDLVTIIVRVSKTAKSNAKLESKKDWTHEWALDEWIRFSDLHGIVPASLSHGTPSVAFDLKNDYGGDGKYDRKDSLTTRVQARVIDVKPNGNLVLEATNTVCFGEEDYTIALTGVCRSRDVTAENTVLSSQIADLEIRVVDRGAVNDATRRGWLMRGFDLLRPF